MMPFIHRWRSLEALLGEWTSLVEIYSLTSLGRSFRSPHVHRSIYRRYSRSDYPHRNRPRRKRIDIFQCCSPLVILLNPSWLRVSLPSEKNTRGQWSRKRNQAKGKDVFSSSWSFFQIVIIRVLLLLLLLLLLRNRNMHQSTWLISMRTSPEM